MRFGFDIEKFTRTDDGRITEVEDLIRMATDSRKRILKIWVSPELFKMLNVWCLSDTFRGFIVYGENGIPVVIDPDIRADRLVLECEEEA